MLWAFMYMRFVHLTLHSRSRLRSRTHILANVIETNKRSLPNSRLSFFIVLVLSARLAILTGHKIGKKSNKAHGYLTTDFNSFSPTFLSSEFFTE